MRDNKFIFIFTGKVWEEDWTDVRARDTELHVVDVNQSITSIPCTTPVSSKGHAISVSYEGVLNYACLRTYPALGKLSKGMLVFFQLHLHTKEGAFNFRK